MSNCNVKVINFGDLVVTWTPVGLFEGVAKDSSAITGSFREDGGELTMSADGVNGTLDVDNDYSGTFKIKLDRSSPTYAALRNSYEAGKGELGTLVAVQSDGETWSFGCAFIKNIGERSGGYRAGSGAVTEVTFEAANFNYSPGV